MKLKIINNDEHSTHVALSGRFDCEGVAEVFEDFKRNVTDRKLPAILDMTEMDFISSLGLRTLQVAAQELKTHGAKLVLYNPQPVVQPQNVMGVNPYMNQVYGGQPERFSQRRKLRQLILMKMNFMVVLQLQFIFSVLSLERVLKKLMMIYFWR